MASQRVIAFAHLLIGLHRPGPGTQVIIGKTFENRQLQVDTANSNFADGMQITRDRRIADRIDVQRFDAFKIKRRVLLFVFVNRVPINMRHRCLT